MKKQKMETECCQDKFMNKCHHHSGHCPGQGSSGAIYGLGVVGALYYFLQGTLTFGMVMTGIVKSIFWPAILMFKLLTYLQM